MILTAPTVTKFGDKERGAVVVAGSHGGVIAGYLAASAGLRAVILNDAGIGMDSAGIGCLTYLDEIGMAAATVSHITARIGNGRDMLDNGIISKVNKTAATYGCREGETAEECAQKMQAAAMPYDEPAAYEEARFLFREGNTEANNRAPTVWGVDSASLLRREDIGQILITGSHGGLPSSDPASAAKVDVLAAVFNDAGVGKDGAGLTRLPALDNRGIAGITVDCMTARIGEARSTWESGIVSHVNAVAAAAGVAQGMRMTEMVDCLTQWHKIRH